MRVFTIPRPHARVDARVLVRNAAGVVAHDALGLDVASRVMVTVE